MSRCVAGAVAALARVTDNMVQRKPRLLARYINRLCDFSGFPTAACCRLECKVLVPNGPAGCILPRFWIRKWNSIPFVNNSRLN
jgi:hypothetical protein